MILTMIWLSGQILNHHTCFFDYGLTMILGEKIIIIVKIYEYTRKGI
ncbi:hypothetical protein BDGGKGIB_01989 [Nodularia sphaerocarpa UHCC 0038]|nr:hypothetical protein BDGGKGIB_01989 [Nodularia sphaerocarpa UHCC 0038]